MSARIPWAFSPIACLEAWISATREISVDLSEEVLVSDCCQAGDCSSGYLDDSADRMARIGTTTKVDDPTEPGGGYFLAKNSWGPDFGPYEGYVAVAYDSNCSFGIEAIYFDRLVIR